MAVALPLAFAAAVAAITLVPSVGSEPGVVRAVLGAAVALVAWAAVLYLTARRAGRTLALEVILRRPHYLQACVQLTLLAYWGWHVRSVYAYVPLIVAQLFFAYGLDALLQWSRRDTFQIGAGAFPIVLSIQFFLWFKPDWFHWQFVLIALGYLAKEFVRWTKDGRRAHIFNPSSFTLAVFSLVLILTGTSDTTFGLEIAQTLFNPPHIYLLIFAIALPAQILFGVATMTLAAMVTTYAWGLAYFSATEIYFFRDAFVPVPVFLGMTLLFTDPATSPRTELGRVMFGVLYGVFIIGLAALLESVGAPTFFDKLLPIPILNLMVRRLDRIGSTAGQRLADLTRGVPSLTAARRRLAVVATWSVLFAGMSASGGVGDRHPGQYLPFWTQACEATGGERACAYVSVMEQNYCDRGSGWACNELGIHLAGWGGDRGAATSRFERSCALGFTPACSNVLRLTMGTADFTSAPPPVGELPIVLRGSKGPITERDPRALYALGCARGWTELCGPRGGVTAESRGAS